MKQILLTQGKYAIVDDEDFDRVNQYKWYYTRGYACRNIGGRYHKQCIWMHRFVLNLPRDRSILIDHKNGNRADNRKENLRICNDIQNAINTIKPPAKNNGGYRGVQYFSYDEKRKKRWVARIRVNHKILYLGYFLTALEAALAYNQAALEYHGEFARLNEIYPNPILTVPSKTA